MFNKKVFTSLNHVKAFIHGYGSFGEIQGTVEHKDNTVIQKTEEYRFECKYNFDKYGVCTREDSFANISDHPIKVNCLKSRFIFDGGEYQVYTQFNCSNNESYGSWQNLVTCVSATGASLRTTEDATPFLALWNEQVNRGVAFHLLPTSTWEMKAVRVSPDCKYVNTVCEMGLLNYNMDIELAPGETLKLPKIVCYEFHNKTDMDAYKLHNYMHTHYPRRPLPVIYDTWMYCADKVSVEKMEKQIPLAAELGVEYFFIDAGWFGKDASWSRSVGDWSENLNAGFRGRLAEVADMVRAAGMKFGLWLEPERATHLSDAVRDYPQYYMKGDEEPFYFLDFANDKAREWMLNIVFGIIEKYGVEYIKNDFNADMYFDPRNSAFTKYHEGRNKFNKAICERYPNIYLSGCAAGGQCMELNQYTRFNSFWPSDNESPYDEMRIYRDTILRLPPQAMERWVAVHSLLGYESLYGDWDAKNPERLIACADSTWHNVIGVQLSYLDAYMTCGPIGLSSDLTKLSEKVFAHMKEFIENFKKDREFWTKAVARILCNTPSLTVYQYSDMDLSKVIIQFVTMKPQQNTFFNYPVLCENKKYRVNGEEKIFSGKELMDEGVSIFTGGFDDNWKNMYQVVIEEVK